jgi:hypothetical protein
VVQDNSLRDADTLLSLRMNTADAYGLPSRGHKTVLHDRQALQDRHGTEIMKHAAIIAFTLIALTAPAAAREPSAPDNTIYEGKCLLVVDGHTYVDGPCEIQAWGPKAKRGFDITATVGPRTWKASGSSHIVWNMPEVAEPGKRLTGLDGKPAIFGIIDETPLGRARKKGDCYVNKRARICASPPPR